MSMFMSETRARLLRELAENPGWEEGVPCNRVIAPGEICDGVVIFDPEDCRCSTSPMPPCGSCVNYGMTCPTCGWRQSHDD